MSANPDRGLANESRVGYLCTRRRTHHEAEGDPVLAKRTIIVMAGLVLFLGAVVAACGGDDSAAPAPAEEPASPPAEEPAAPAEEPPAPAEEPPAPAPAEEPSGGDPVAGKTIFAENGCANCHTLADADASGNIGPNLDESQPSLELVIDRVTNGAGSMPSFGDLLGEQGVADVAAYVVEATT